MKRCLIQVIISALAVCCVSAQRVMGEDAFRTGGIVLYNQMDEFEARSPSAEVLASFIMQLGENAAKLIDTQKDKTGRSGLIAVAIRPDRTLKLWVDIEEVFQPDTTAALEKKMKAIGVPQAKQGPIAFAVHFDLFGGSHKAKNADEIALPQSWLTALQKQNKQMAIPNDVLPLVWPAQKGGKMDSVVFVPDGFVLQELKPTGGKILRPKDWIYTENHSQNVLMWTISNEKQADGGYETGVRIQCFIGVKEHTGQSPQAFIQSFIDSKEKSSKVISTRPRQVQGLFARVGLETEEKVPDGDKEKTYRILYSCFWGTDADIAIVSISGTTPDLWNKYTGIFDTMSSFELIDMSKFKESTPKAEAGSWKTIKNSSEWRPPPDGYDWAECAEINSAFLKPNGWHYDTRNTALAQIFSIRRDAKETAATPGLTISVIKECEKKTKSSAGKYYDQFAAQYAKGTETLYSKEPAQQGDLTLYRAELTKTLPDKIKYHVMLFGIANSKTDTLQIFKFTCPEDKWEEYQNTVNPIVQNLVVNENL